MIYLTQKKGRNVMAKGMKCPKCSHPMYAESENKKPGDDKTVVFYVCRNGDCKYSLSKEE